MILKSTKEKYCSVNSVKIHFEEEQIMYKMKIQSLKLLKKWCGNYTVRYDCLYLAMPFCTEYSSVFVFKNILFFITYTSVHLQCYLWETWPLKQVVKGYYLFVSTVLYTFQQYFIDVGRQFSWQELVSIINL